MKNYRQSGLLMAAFAVTALGACSQLQQRDASIDPYLIRIRELEQRLASLEQQKAAAAQANISSQDFALIEELTQQDEEVRRLQGEVEMARYQRQQASQQVIQRPLPDSNSSATAPDNGAPMVPPLPSYRGESSAAEWPATGQVAVRAQSNTQSQAESINQLSSPRGYDPLSIGVSASAPPVQVIAPGTSSSSWPVVGSVDQSQFQERVIQPSQTLPQPAVRGGALMSAEAVPVQEVFRTASGSTVSPEVGRNAVDNIAASQGYNEPYIAPTQVVTVAPNTVVADPNFDANSGYGGLGYQPRYGVSTQPAEQAPKLASDSAVVYQAQQAQAPTRAPTQSTSVIYDDGASISLPAYAMPITPLSAQSEGAAELPANTVYAEPAINKPVAATAAADVSGWPQVVVPEPKLSKQRIDTGEPALASYQAPAGAGQVANGFVEFGGERDRYRSAYEALQERRYKQATKAFQSFVSDHPKSDYADNAQYWLGESYYVTRDFDNALLEFSRVIERYPNSTKVADAQLKIGYVYYEQKRWALARQTLESVGYEHKGTRAAELAGQRLQRLEREGY